MKLVFTPDWFLGTDVFIEVFSFFILLAFFILSYRSYKLNGKKSSLYLGLGFLVISVAELSTVLTKLVLYYNVFFSQQIGQMIVTYKVVKSVDIFYYIGFFFHKLFTLMGFYMIYRIPAKRKMDRDVIFALCFIIISVLFSEFFYYVFHITALILLMLILASYIEVYKKNRSENTKMLIVAFSLLALSQLIFVLSQLQILYVIGQVIQLVSYLILLVLVIRILKLQNYVNGRKKEKQNGNNSRHAGSNSRKAR